MNEATLAELKVMLDLYPTRRKHIVSNAAKRNMQEARRNGYRAYDNSDWSFNRPCKWRGYGAIILGLQRLPAHERTSQAKVMLNLFKQDRERWGNTTWQGLVSGGLVHKSKDTRAWEVTPFGKLYAQEML